MSEEVMLNKSQTYLLPLLSELVPFRMDMLEMVDQTYISDNEGRYKDCFFVLHDFSFRSPDFTVYENALVKSECFVDLIDIGNKVLYVFKMPDEYMHEFNCYKAGRYSDFGVDAKELILSFWTSYFKSPEDISFVLKTKQILFKDKRLKEQLEKELSSIGNAACAGHRVVIHDDAELSDPPDLERETVELPKK